MELLIILLVVLGGLGLWLMGLYNSLVTLRVRTEETWSGIDTELKKRYDLIPNLIETVKGYASHEKEVFEAVTKARSQAMQAGSPEEQMKADNMLSGALKSLFAVAEAYPDLKANENFMHLQQTLGATEEDIQSAREVYNVSIKQYNTAVQVFPANLVAGIFGFIKKEFFEVVGVERENVKVKF